jgi:hypothetical protein
MHDLRLPLANDPRELPRGRQVDFVARRERNEIGPLRGPAIELAVGVRHQDSFVAKGTEPQDRQEDLVLSAAPGPGGVDVEGEHSSESFANLSPT